MVEVELSNSEILNAAMWGCFRNVQSWKNANDKHGANTERDGWQLNIMACLSEMAWSKHKRVYYNASIGNYNAADVDDYYQIRASSIIYRNNACLRFHPSDDNEKPYILALVGMGKVVFSGWLWGAEGKQHKYWCDKWNVGRPAYFVEQSDLRPIETL